MEKKHDRYHVRPFPQQPKPPGKELSGALDLLEREMGGKEPARENLLRFQQLIHEAMQKTNDAKLVDMVRQLSTWLDRYHERPSRLLAQRIVQQVLKIRIALKHLHA